MTPVFASLLVVAAAVGVLAYRVYQLQRKLEAMGSPAESMARLDQQLAELRRAVSEEFPRSRQEASTQARDLRQEVAGALKNQSDSLLRGVGEMATLQKTQLELFAANLKSLTDTFQNSQAALRDAMQSQFRELQKDNSEHLERMRATVDEKLQTTLERRLSESFQRVGESLETVQKGLGEMRALASGVGNLSRLLTNVKSRGIWGEVQLKALLEDVLTKERYEENVATKERSNERVEFAIRLPGQSENGGRPVWLPIDSKFPLEVYQRLAEARDLGDAARLEEARKELVAAIKVQARKIAEKYLDPPGTTDFGILYLPTEGLYAEVMQVAGLFESVQREFRIAICGPATLAAFLNALHLGFNTLSIAQQASEVAKLLGAVKTEFGKFGDLLEATKKKIDAAGDSLEKAAQKSRGIERKLKQVQEIPAGQAHKLLADVEPEGGDAEPAAAE